MELKDYIADIHRIKEEKKRIALEEKRLGTPMIENLAMFDEVFRYCLEGYGQIHPEKKITRKEACRSLLFVTLFLFSPKTLSGGKIRTGLRSKLADALHTTAANISHYTTNLMFFYNHYADFREEVNLLFHFVYKSLKINS